MQSQIRAALTIIQNNGGSISVYDLLEKLGHDPTSSNIVRQLVFKLRNEYVQYDGSTIKINLDRVNPEEVQKILENLSTALVRKEKFQEHIKFVAGLILGLVIGFLIALKLASFEVFNELDCENMLELLTPLLNGS